MPAGTDHLNANEALAPNQAITSASGIYRLILQGDSNLVLYKLDRTGSQRPLWASNTVGRGAVTCIMQGDGNLVLYDRANHPVWASNTAGNPGSRLVMQDDGNAVIYRANNTPAWATNTVQAALPSGPPAHGNAMQPGETLLVNGAIHSASGRYTLVFQGDGNLVLYDGRTQPLRPLWASNTANRPVAVCIMQGDRSSCWWGPRRCSSTPATIRA